MDLILVLARLLLAAVFVVAGLAKLADRRGSQQAMREFGLPDVLAVPAGNLLPIGEIVVAVALLPVGTAWWGAVGALGLLVAFIGGIAINMARGKAPNCHCFGQLHSEPAGWRTLLRNLGLGLVAAFIVLEGALPGGVGVGPSILGWLSTLGPTGQVVVVAAIALLAAIGAVGWVLLKVLQQQGRLVRRLELLEAQFAGGASPVQHEGLAPGTEAPEFVLPNLEGRAVSLRDLRSGGLPVFLLFWDPQCNPCRELLPKAARWQREHAATFSLVPISRGDVEDNRRVIAATGLSGVLLEDDREIDLLYNVEATPTGVLVLSDGTIGGPLAAGSAEIESFVEGLAGRLGDSPLFEANGRGHDHSGESLGGLGVGNRSGA